MIMNKSKKLLLEQNFTRFFKKDVCNYTAQLLSEGKIIGWFQDSMEIGPRALGSRSILANTAFPNMKEKSIQKSSIEKHIDRLLHLV